MPRYVSPMYYRDWELPLNRVFTTLNAGASTGMTLVLYTASIPTGASVVDLTLYLYIHLPDGGTLRVSFGGVSADREGTGLVKLVVPGSSVPQSVKDGFGVNPYRPITIDFTNIGSQQLRFALMFYMPWLQYDSNGVPAPYYFGTDPYGSSGNYVDFYQKPGYVGWATRFSYRGVRTAFPFVVIGQSIAQLYASVATDMLQHKLRVQVGGSNLRLLYQQIMRWFRMARIDGVYTDTYWGG